MKEMMKKWSSRSKLKCFPVARLKCTVTTQFQQPKERKQTSEAIETIYMNGCETGNR